MKRFITLKSGQLLLNLFNFIFFSLYFKSITLSALLLIFHFLFPSSTLEGSTPYFSFIHISYVLTLQNSLFIVFLLLLSYYTYSLPSILSLFTFIFCAAFLPTNPLYTYYICKAQYNDN